MPVVCVALLLCLSTSLYASTYKAAVEYLHQNNEAKARWAFFSFYKKNPQQYRAPYALYSYVKLLSNKDKAKRFLLLLLKRYPHFPLLDDALDDLGALMFLSARYDLSYEYYNEIVKRFKKSRLRSKAYYYMTLSLLQEKRFEEARSCAAKALREIQGYYAEQVKALLVKIDYARGGAEERNFLALQKLQHAFVQPSALYLIAQGYEMLGNRALYEWYRAECVKKFPKSLESYFIQGVQSQGSSEASPKRYYLQFGAFHEYEKAQSVVERLRAHKVQGTILTQKRKDTFLYKVLSEFSSFTTLQETKQRLWRVGLNGWVLGSSLLQ